MVVQIKEDKAVTKVEQTQARLEKEMEWRIARECMLLTLKRNGFNYKEIGNLIGIKADSVRAIVRMAKAREEYGYEEK